MARIEIPAGDLPESIRLLQLQPAMGNAMAVLAEAIYAKSGLDKRLREAIRMRVAQINQCQVCLNFRFPELVEAGITEEFYDAVGDWKESNLLSDKEKLVIDYTERFVTEHLKIDDAFFSQLNKQFTATEIYEITSTIAGLMANGRVLQVLQIEQSCAI